MRYLTFFTAAALVTQFAAPAFATEITPPPFHVGEKLSYSLKWKKAISVTAGRLTTEITKLDLQSGAAEFKATATSSSVVDAFYPIRYTVLSSMNLAKLASTHFELRGREKNEYKDQIEDFVYSKQKGKLNLVVNKKENGVAEKKKDKQQEYALTTDVQDVLSLLYYIRAAKLPTSEGEVKVPVVYEGEIWNASIKFVQEETAKVNGTRYPAYQYQLINVSPSGETNSATRLWIADDSAKTIVRVESEVEVGKIILKLRDTSSVAEEE